MNRHFALEGQQGVTLQTFKYSVTEEENQYKSDLPMRLSLISLSVGFAATCIIQTEMSILWLETSNSFCRSLFWVCRLYIICDLGLNI